MTPEWEGAVRTDSYAIGLAFAMLSLACTSACGTGVRQQQPDRETLTVGVTTSGDGVSTMTFRVAIDPAGISGTVSADAGVFTSNDVPPGQHVVRLLDVPARCRVDGGPERTVTIAAHRGSMVLRFNVVCRAVARPPTSVRP
jgi:hypothetical protein